MGNNDIYLTNVTCAGCRLFTIRALILPLAVTSTLTGSKRWSGFTTSIKYEPAGAINEKEPSSFRKASPRRPPSIIILVCQCQSSD